MSLLNHWDFKSSASFVTRTSESGMRPILGTCWRPTTSETKTVHSAGSARATRRGFSSICHKHG